MQGKLNAIEVIEDRRNGLTCRECAEKYGVPEHAIWNLMKATGNAGRWQHQPKTHASPGARPGGTQAGANLRTKQLIEGALDMSDEVTIERGLAGGYIVGIGEVVGREERDLNSALRSAYRKYEAEQGKVC